MAAWNQYLPDFLHQEGGTNDCWACAGAVGVSFVTRGKRHPTEQAFRKSAGRWPQGTPGSTYDIQKGAANVFDVRASQGELAVMRYLTWADFRLKLDKPWLGFAMFNDYETVTDKSCLETFDGQHVVFVVGGTIDQANDGSDRILIYDSLCNKTKKWTLADLRKTGEKYGYDNQRRYGPGNNTGYITLVQFRQKAGTNGGGGGGGSGGGIDPPVVEPPDQPDPCAPFRLEVAHSVDSALVLLSEAEGLEREAAGKRAEARKILAEYGSGDF
jgi:hypothetical protein